MLVINSRSTCCRFHSLPVLYQSASLHWHLLPGPVPLLAQYSEGQVHLCSSVGGCVSVSGPGPLLLTHQVLSIYFMFFSCHILLRMKFFKSSFH